MKLQSISSSKMYKSRKEGLMTRYCDENDKYFDQFSSHLIAIHQQLSDI